VKKEVLEKIRSNTIHLELFATYFTEIAYNGKIECLFLFLPELYKAGKTAH